MPGRYSQTWFEATEPGALPGAAAPSTAASATRRCAAEIVVMPPAEFDAWLAEQRAQLAGASRRRQDPLEDLADPRASLAEQGRRAGRVGTAASSATPSTARAHIGPTWLDLYRAEETLQDGDDRGRRRGLPHRVDDGSAGKHRGGLPARDADLPGPPPAARRSPPSSSSSSRCAQPTRCAPAAARRAPSMSRSPAHEPAPADARLTTPAPAEPRNYLNAEAGDPVLAAARATTSASAIMFLVRVTAVAVPRRPLRAAASASSCSRPAPTIMNAHDLQPHVHAARRGHDLPVHDPGHPVGASATSCCRS